MLKRVVITEKALALAKQGWYTFEVAKEATKKAIERLLKEKYGVDAVEIRTVTIDGKRKYQRLHRGYYFTPEIKKALVKLQPGQKLKIFEELMPEEEEEKEETKQKRSVLKGTKVKIEKKAKQTEKNGTKNSEEPKSERKERRRKASQD